MSLLIEGMDMPKNMWIIYDCLLMISSDGSCEMLFNGKSYPVVEIHTPHGRLIDADRLLEPERIAKFPSGQEILFADAIRYAPTIVEAEGKS